MSGITILTQHEIVKTVENGWWIAAIIFGVLSILLFFIALAECSEGCGWMAFGFFLVFISCLIMGGVSRKEVSTVRYEYQVLIDETVDINELASRYDIIGQDGLIWTIQDKEPIE